MRSFLSIYQKASLFQGINDAELTAILETLSPTVREYPSGATVYCQGERVHSIGIVLSGTVQGVRNNFGGNEILMAKMGPGDLFGEILVCTQELQSPVSIRANGSVTIAFISFDALVDCGARHSLLLRNLFSVIGVQYFELWKKLDYLSKKSTRERLLAFMCDMHYEKGTSMFELPFSQTALANYLGVERSAMARELSRMKRDGLLDYYGRSIKLFPCAQCSRRH